MWVKICANTNLEDTQLAIDLGADAVGFVFAPSGRRVTPTQVGSITAGLRAGSPAAERIGVFQTTSFEEIANAVTTAALTGVQLHHEPQPRLIASLRRRFGAGLTLAQTLHWHIDAPAAATAKALAAQVEQLENAGGLDRILVDTRVGSALGGTGRSFDWESAAALFHQPGKTQRIVAGGLNPENIGAAVERLDPWGVDVASGVEQSAGRKDPARLRLFLERARAVGKTAT